MNNASAMIKPEAGAIELTANGVKMKDVAQVFAFSELLNRAGMLPKGTTIEGAAVAIIAGAPLGLNPFQAVQGIASINGRPAIWGDAMVALVLGSGLLEDEQVEYLPSPKDCQGVRVTVKRRGQKTAKVGMFSKSMAEKAGLWGKPGPWTHFPERMLLSRARAFAYRDAFADILKGVRVAEEEQDIVDVTISDPPQPTTRPRVKRASAAELLDGPTMQVNDTIVAVEESVSEDKSIPLPM